MDIESFDDLKGKTLQVGAPGSSDETHTRTLYGILGWEWEKDFTAQYMPGEQAIELFKDNMISGFVANANQPFAPFMEVFMDGRAKILDVPETALAALCDGPDALYIRATIPANTYDNQDYDVSTFCAKLVCVANASADEELIYQITKYVMEHAEDIASENAVLAEFNPEYCVSDINIPFHPGAERYYKEIGLL